MKKTMIVAGTTLFILIFTTSVFAATTTADTPFLTTVLINLSNKTAKTLAAITIVITGLFFPICDYGPNRKIVPIIFFFALATLVAGFVVELFGISGGLIF